MNHGTPTTRALACCLCLALTSTTLPGCGDESGPADPASPAAPTAAERTPLVVDGEAGEMWLEDDAVVFEIGGEVFVSPMAEDYPVAKVIDDTRSEFEWGDETALLEKVSADTVRVSLPSYDDVEIHFPDGFPLAESSDGQIGTTQQGVAPVIVAAAALGLSGIALTAACAIGARYTCGFGNVAAWSVYSRTEGLCTVICEN